MKKKDNDEKLRAEFVVPFINQRSSYLQSGSNPMKLLINMLYLQGSQILELHFVLLH